MKNRILTSLLCFIPTIIGILIWNFLPSDLAIHFGAFGPDGFEDKFIIVFIIPFMFFILDILYKYIAYKHPSWLGKNGFDKYNYLFPIISIFVFLFSITNTI